MGGKYDNEAFLEALEESKEGVWRIARWLSDQGHHVKVNAIAKAPSVGQRYKYLDGGDLEISQRVEVKHLTASFTCKEDWPFSCMVICDRSSWEAAMPKPFAYVHLNKAGTHAAIVKGENSANWKVVQRQPKGDPYPHDCMATELSTVKFVKL